ncbi:hypothetical protein BKA69DRAFT_1176758 [Paraphysoderma sedebokerense]|nr:hypothetical protein BKA69DRAFT_1176758 [Paraphysoderma sedebokerense]
MNTFVLNGFHFLCCLAVYNLLLGCPINVQGQGSTPFTPPGYKAIQSSRHIRRRGNFKDITSGSYILIGYHGTCSNNRNIEEKITIPLQKNFESTKLQLGNRFYTSNRESTAQIYAYYACINYQRRNPTSTIPVKPLMCPVFMKATSLKTLPKIYIPKSIPERRGHQLQLWHNHENIKLIEKSAIRGRVKPVRFAVLPLNTPGRKEIQAAWPENAVKNMVTRCLELPGSKLPMDQLIHKVVWKDDIKVGYEELLEKSKQGAENIGSWGSPIFGADTYDLSRPDQEGITDENNVFTKLLKEK